MVLGLVGMFASQVCVSACPLCPSRSFTEKIGATWHAYCSIYLLKASEFFFAKVTKQSNQCLISVVMGTSLDSHNDQGLQH